MRLNWCAEGRLNLDRSTLHKCHRFDVLAIFASCVKEQKPKRKKLMTVSEHDYSYTLQMLDTSIRHLRVLHDSTLDEELKKELLSVYEMLMSALLATDRRYIRDVADTAVAEWESRVARTFADTRIDAKEIGTQVIHIFRDQRMPMSVILQAMPLLCRQWRESMTGIFEEENTGYAVAASWRDQYKELLRAVVRACGEPPILTNLDAPGLPARHLEVVKKIPDIFAERAKYEKEVCSALRESQAQVAAQSLADQELRGKLKNLWYAFLSQAERCNFIDEHGHMLLSNATVGELDNYIAQITQPDTQAVRSASTDNKDSSKATTKEC
jgi:hypothetical protein